MTTAIIIGADGNVGSAIKEACLAAGWEVLEAHPDTGRGFGDCVVFDCGPAGYSGYDPLTWDNLYCAVERAVRLARKCEKEGALCLMVCSSPYAEWEPEKPYGTTKLLIETLCRAQTLHGKCPMIYDRIGAQHPPGTALPAHEEPIRQAPGQLGRRVLARVQTILDSRQQ